MILIGCDIGYTRLGRLEITSQWCGYKRTGGLTSSDTSQAYVQGFELASSNISTPSMNCYST